MVSSLANVFFLFGVLTIHEIYGTTQWFGHKGHSDPVRRNSSADPVLKFNPGGKGPEGKHHGSRKTRSLWSKFWDVVKSLFGRIPSPQEISERLKELEEKMHNISETGGEGYPDVGDLGKAYAHFEHFDPYDYYDVGGPNVELR